MRTAFKFPRQRNTYHITSPTTCSHRNIRTDKVKKNSFEQLNLDNFISLSFLFVFGGELVGGEVVFWCEFVGGEVTGNP